MVLIFGIGVFALVTTLVAMGDAAIKSEYGRHRQKQLAAVVKAGIAASLNEINAHRNDPTSPDTGGGADGTDPDGYGAYTVGADGKDGIPVTTDGINATTGVVLGRFRTMIDRDQNGATVMMVVAVWPAFNAADAGLDAADYDKVKQMSCAELELKRTRPSFPANAFSVSGPTSRGGGPGFTFSNNPDVSMADPSITVPAVNISDSTTHTNFMDGLVPTATIEGLNPETGGAGTGAESVTNEDPGILKEAVFDAIVGVVGPPATGLTKVVEDARADALGSLVNTVVVTQTMVDAWATNPLNDSTKTYIFQSDVEFPNNFEATGARFIIDGADVTVGHDVTFHGDFIVWDNPDTHVYVGPGDDLIVNGVMAVVSTTDESRVLLELKGGGGGQDPSGLTVNGALVVLLDNTDTNIADGNLGLTLQNGCNVTVNGILALMGEGVSVDLQAGSHWTVNGSMAITVPDDASQGIHEFDLSQGSHCTFTFDGPKFNSALDELGEFFDPDGTILPLTLTTYWERSAEQVNTDQEALMADTTYTSNTLKLGTQ